MIGVRFVDGAGRLLSGGGKVVKNAAGFDLPKLMVGSLGRLGIMTQLSFKVFPSPRGTVTLEFEPGTTAAALRAASELTAGARQLDAVDVLPGGRLLVRIGGDPQTLAPRCARLAASGITGPLLATHEDERDREIWADAAELSWAGEDVAAVRVPISLGQAVELEQAVAALNGTVRFALAVNVAWVGWPCDLPLARLGEALRAMRLSGVVLSGADAPALIGAPLANAFGERVRRALDPFERFLEV